MTSQWSFCLLYRHVRSWQVSFSFLPSVNPEDFISGSNSGLRVVGGFHKSLEQQKTVPPKSHPFSGVKSDQLVYWSFKLGWHPTSNQNGQTLRNLSDPVRSSSTRPLFPRTPCGCKRRVQKDLQLVFHCIRTTVCWQLLFAISVSFYFRENSVCYLKFSKSDRRFVRFGVSDVCSVLAGAECAYWGYNVLGVMVI